MKILVQIGYQKASRYRKEGQKIQAWVNDEECSWQDNCGIYVTSRLDASRGVLWYLWKGEISPSDLLRIKVSTAIVNVGMDEQRTFERLYYASDDAEVCEVTISGVGSKGHPLLKGRLVEMASVSEADKREADIGKFLEDDF